MLLLDDPPRNHDDVELEPPLERDEVSEETGVPLGRSSTSIAFGLGLGRPSP